MLSYSLPGSGLSVPVKIKTDGGFAILINQLPIGDFSQDIISCSQPIDMNHHLVKNVKSVVNKFDPVNKAYVDRIKYKTSTGIIPNIAMTDQFSFISSAKAFCQLKYNNM